jgi:hypothetical protein
MNLEAEYNNRALASRPAPEAIITCISQCAQSCAARETSDE